MIGFIGLGLMGKPMARRLLRAGYRLVVHNRSRRPVDELVAEGAEAAWSPREVAEKTDVVITMLPDSPEVEMVLIGVKGVIEGAERGLIVVDMSTISPIATKSIAEKLEKRGIEMLDAPVSGGTAGAEAGTLSIMVGGKREIFEEVKPILQVLGKKITYMGGHGAGQATKICNQVAISGALLGVAEALLLASSYGLDPRKVIDVLSGGAANSWQLTNLGPKMIERDFEPGFKIAHFRKDLRIAREIGEEKNLPLLGAGIVYELLKAVEADKLGEKGTQALILALEKLASKSLERNGL